jgi:hypothetical protein
LCLRNLLQEGVGIQTSNPQRHHHHHHHHQSAPSTASHPSMMSLEMVAPGVMGFVVWHCNWG